MQNQALFNGASTLAVDLGKLHIVRVGVDINNIDAARYIPMDIPSIFSVEVQAGAAGASRTQTVTVTGTPTAGTLYKLTIRVFKESDWGFFGPQLVTFDVQFTAADAVANNVAIGLNAALNAIGAYFGVTSTVATNVVTVTSNTTVPQNIDILSTGAGAVTIAQTVAFTKPYGLAAELQLRGITSAVTGQLYTKYVFKTRQGIHTGHVGPGTEFLEQTLWVNTVGSSGLVTALNAFRDAPFTSPAAYNL
jgi:hypothetical protein